MNAEQKKAKLIVILVSILIITLVLLKVVVNQKERNDAKNFAEEKLSGTSWPLNEVPALCKENMTIKDDEYICEIEIKSGVSYNELKSYLIELYNSGFEPNKSFGSDNPNYMTSSTENMELKEVLWIGMKDNYQITVTWAEEGATNEFGDVYNVNFIATLYTGKKDK